MFDSLSDRLGSVFDRLRGRGALTEADVRAAMREVRVALLEADVALPVAPRLTLAGELWSNFNFDPAGSIKQASADAALAYALSNDIQLDVGTNLGLTRETPDFEIYAGASIRF